MSVKRIVIVVVGLLVAAAAAAAGLAAFAWQSLNAPLAFDQSHLRVVVEPGSSLARIGSRLYRDGVLTHPRIFALYGRASGLATNIKVGEFDVPRGTTAIELIDQLVSGEVVQYSFTIIEGWRYSDMLAALREHEAIELTGIDDATVMEHLGKPEVHPEGQFLPDTYHFPRGTRDVDVLSRAHDALVETLERAWAGRSADLGLTTPYEALILASIVEKETGLERERREIAGVFSRRLDRGMRLQADPTVIYGLGESWDGDIRRRDLDTDTPYNTYTRAGLPPTPIALAGTASIMAAVDPLPGDSLYFVATGEPDRSHYFSATLEEHNAAVQRYLERLRAERAAQ